MTITGSMTVFWVSTEDELVDMFPGTGAVSKAWDSWKRQGSILADRPGHSQDTLETECT